MNRKIAIPVDENGKLNTHFGHSTLFAIFTAEGNKIASIQKLVPPPHMPGAIPKWLVEITITDVIAGGIGEKATKILEHFDVKVHKGASVKQSTELAEDLLNNTLELIDENCRHDHHHDHLHHHSEENSGFEYFRLNSGHKNQKGEN